MGFPMRPPLLIVEEYDNWKMRMERFLKGKYKDAEKLFTVANFEDEV